MTTADPSRFASFALELAEAARQATLPRWAECCPAENKGSGAFDPVTEADREAERVMRTLIEHRFPDHGVSGEEWPDRPAAGPFSWSLDPIDGTRSFICRLPSWVTLIALLDHERPTLGLIDAPCLDELYIGFGDEARMIWKGENLPINTSGCSRIADARLSTTDPFLFNDERAFDRVQRAARMTRYGHDGYAYARVAAGTLDLVVECGLKPHDYNALIPLVTAAGGHIGDWRGGSDFAAGEIVAAATSALYYEAVELLARAE